MSGEQNPRKKAIESASRDKAKDHQTRRARGGKETKEKVSDGAALSNSTVDIIFSAGARNKGDTK